MRARARCVRQEAPVARRNERQKLLGARLRALGLGLRVHRRFEIVAFGALAIAALAIAALWGHSAWDPSVEIVVNVAASVALATAHWRNFREVRRLHRH